MASPFPPQRVKLARRIAVIVDLVQIAALPALVTGAPGVALEVAIDVVAAVTLSVILRPHWAFAPTFLLESLPFADACPFWWLAVRYVTRDSSLPATAAPPDALPGWVDRREPTRSHEENNTDSSVTDVSPPPKPSG